MSNLCNWAQMLGLIFTSDRWDKQRSFKQKWSEPRRQAISLTHSWSTYTTYPHPHAIYFPRTLLHLCWDFSLYQIGLDSAKEFRSNCNHGTHTHTKTTAMTQILFLKEARQTKLTDSPKNQHTRGIRCCFISLCRTSEISFPDRHPALLYYRIHSSSRTLCLLPVTTTPSARWGLPLPEISQEMTVIMAPSCPRLRPISEWLDGALEEHLGWLWRTTLSCRV